MASTAWLRPVLPTWSKVDCGFAPNDIYYFSAKHAVLRSKGED